MFFQEKKQILIFVATGLLVTGFVLFRYIPLRNRIKSLDQKQALLETGFNTTSLQSKQIPILKKQLKKLKNKAGDFDASVPENKTLGNFLQKIAALMNEHNLKEQIVKHEKEIKAEKFSCIPLIIKCKGRLDQMYGFFESLQALDRVVRIQKITLQNDENFNGELKMQTRAFIYYRDGLNEG